MNRSLVADGTIGQDKNQVQALWYIRENISESLQRSGKVYKYDVSLPVAHMYSLVEKMRQRMSFDERIGVVGYGHLGDGVLCSLTLPPLSRSPSHASFVFFCSASPSELTPEHIRTRVH